MAPTIAGRYDGLGELLVSLSTTPIGWVVLGLLAVVGLVSLRGYLGNGQPHDPHQSQRGGRR